MIAATYSLFWRTLTNDARLRCTFLGMPAPASSPERVQFGVFELDLQSAELRKSGVRVKLQEQSLKILQILLENLGQLVGREELQKNI